MSPIAEERGNESDAEYSEDVSHLDHRHEEFEGDEHDEENEGLELDGAYTYEDAQADSQDSANGDLNLARMVSEQPARISLQTYESVTKEIQAIREKMDWLLRQSESQDYQS